MGGLREHMAMFFEDWHCIYNIFIMIITWPEWPREAFKCFFLSFKETEKKKNTNNGLIYIGFRKK